MDIKTENRDEIATLMYRKAYKILKRLIEYFLSGLESLEEWFWGGSPSRIHIKHKNTTEKYHIIKAFQSMCK